MSGFYDNEYSDLGGAGRQEESGSGLRAMLEEALGEIRTLRGELEKVQTGQRQTSVTDLLESKGINPDVAQIIPEGADPADWLNDFGHLFGSTLDEDESGELRTPEEQDEPDEQLLAEQAAWEAANGLSSQSSGTTTSVSDPFAKLESFQSAEEMIAFISQQSEGRD